MQRRHQEGDDVEEHPPRLFEPAVVGAARVNSAEEEEQQIDAGRDERQQERAGEAGRPAVGLAGQAEVRRDLFRKPAVDRQRERDHEPDQHGTDPAPAHRSPPFPKKRISSPRNS